VLYNRACYCNPSHSYGVCLAMRSHSVTCHPTQVSTSRLKPSQTGWYSIYLGPYPRGMDLPASSHPSKVVTGPSVD